MEITSFVLGMLTIVAIIMLTAIVVGMIKINQLTIKIESLQQLCAAIEGDLRREIMNVHNDMSRENEDIRRNIEDTHRSLVQTINHEVDNIHRHEHELETVLHRDIDETRRYIDSRIDKVVLSGSLKSSKQQLING